MNSRYRAPHGGLQLPELRYDVIIRCTLASGKGKTILQALNLKNHKRQNLHSRSISRAFITGHREQADKEEEEDSGGDIPFKQELQFEIFKKLCVQTC